ncbi:DUF397 domain-containing protein [Nonomuraea sp. K274]|uniref:DUF397 domain-containing protein n=1 Tax=Nonomuraea cypriaca TaxID=1187855 RepID=A0A931A3B2_9ACTN|nr:DUF397 domain-containing protein [Nonomuraea cypriaca]
MNFNTANWHKSVQSGNNGGNCVEVAVVRGPSLSDSCEIWDERVLLMRNRARQDDQDSDCRREATTSTNSSWPASIQPSGTSSTSSRGEPFDMTRIPEFHGPHSGSPQPGCVEIIWYEPSRRVRRIRVVAHSCECRQILFELCAAGGQGFVRRTDRAGPTTYESAWMLTAAARSLYDRILRGRLASST